jgi:hypothetical protein
MPASTANNICDSLQGYWWAIHAAIRVQVLLYCAHAVVILGLQCLEGLVKPSLCWLFELLHLVLVLFAEHCLTQSAYLSMDIQVVSPCCLAAGFVVQLRVCNGKLSRHILRHGMKGTTKYQMMSPHLIQTMASDTGSEQRHKQLCGGVRHTCPKEDPL